MPLSTQQSPPRQLGPQQLSVLFFALMATSMGQSLVFAILPPLGREVNLNEVQITSIIAISALVFGLASPRWGRYSDQRGRKPVILIGLVGYALGTIIFAGLFQAALVGMLSGTLLYVLALLFRCSQSAVMSATGPASTAYAADHSSRDQRIKTMAKLGSANSLGTILGPAISGLLATFGLLAPLFFAGVLTAAAALLTLIKLPSGELEVRAERRPMAKLHYRDRRIVRYLICTVGLFIGFSGIQQTLGFRIQDTLQLSGIETAQMTGAALMVSAIFAFLAQTFIVQRLKLLPEQLVRWGLILLFTASFFVAIFDRFEVLAVGMAFMGTGLGFSMPAISACASLAVTQDEQGAVAGLVSSCPAMGFVVGPIAASSLYQLQPVFAAVFSGAVFLAVLLAMLLIKDKQ